MRLLCRTPSACGFESSPGSKQPDLRHGRAFSFSGRLMVPMSHFVYILQSEENDRYYVGRSKNPERRLEHHNTTSTGFTARYRPWDLVFKEEFPTKDKAIAAEQLIKGWKSRTRLVTSSRGKSTWKSGSSRACGCYAERLRHAGSSPARGAVTPSRPVPAGLFRFQPVSLRLEWFGPLGGD